MVAKIQGYARRAYVAAAMSPRLGKLMRNYTAKQGTPISKVLNKVLGAEDTLTRLELFYGPSKSFEVARTYLDVRKSNFDSPVPASVYDIASFQVVGPVSAVEFGKRAASFLIEAGEMSVDQPLIGAGLDPNWNSLPG